MKDHQHSSCKDLTKEDIRAVEEFASLSDEQAEKIAEAIRVYTEIIYACYQQERFEEQKAKVIDLTKAAVKKAA